MLGSPASLTTSTRHLLLCFARAVQYDPDYEPTREDIEDYADVIGLDLQQDPDLEWIAREGLCECPALPGCSSLPLPSLPPVGLSFSLGQPTHPLIVGLLFSSSRRLLRCWQPVALVGRVSSATCVSHEKVSQVGPSHPPVGLPLPRRWQPVTLASRVQREQICGQPCGMSALRPTVRPALWSSL